MATTKLALIREERDGKLVLCAPSVGTLTEAAGRGRLLAAGERAGVLLVLGVAHDLVVPPGVTGRVENPVPDRILAPVSYGDVLFELSPLEAGVTDEAADDAADASGGPVLRAPYAGRFWHRPAPGDPAFVSKGDTVEAGATVGLLEVMKTFTHLSYPSDGSLPSPARVVRVLVDDGAEVGEGEALLEVEAG